MERVVPSKSGLPTALAGGRCLHSAYDPKKEASRFAESRDFPRPPLAILVLGDALGYAARAFREKYPSAVVLSAFCSSFFQAVGGEGFQDDPAFSWHPGNGETFRAFLGRNVRDADVRGFRIVEWEPAFQAYPEEMRNLLSAAVQFGREAAGSVVTTGYFGRKWIRNAIRNFLAAERPSTLESCPGPVLIAASGPGLADAMGTIKGYRERISLWALPSALDFLKDRGLEPDLVVLTDPGFHSGLHFRTHLRGFREKAGGPPVLFPLTALSRPAVSGFPPVLFHQGTAIETRLLARFRPETFYHPANGTVAGSAVGIALARSAGPVFTAGLDLAVKDCVEHVRPNAFDRDSETGDGRLRPLETEKFSRTVLLYPEKIRSPFRTSPSLKTYAGWFSAQKFRGLYRLAPSPVDAGIPEASAAVLENLPREKPALRLAPLPLPGRAERAGIVEDLLDETMREIREAVSLSDLPPRFRDLVMMIDAEGVLNISGTGGTADTAEIPEAVRRGVAGFVESLRPLLGRPG